MIININDWYLEGKMVLGYFDLDLRKCLETTVDIFYQKSWQINESRNIWRGWEFREWYHFSRIVWGSQFLLDKAPVLVTSNDEEDDIHADNTHNDPAQHEAWLPDGPGQWLLLQVPPVPLQLKQQILILDQVSLLQQRLVLRAILVKLLQLLQPLINLLHDPQSSVGYWGSWWCGGGGHDQERCSLLMVITTLRLNIEKRCQLWYTWTQAKKWIV